MANIDWIYTDTINTVKSYYARNFRGIPNLVPKMAYSKWLKSYRVNRPSKTFSDYVVTVNFTILSKNPLLRTPYTTTEIPI
jgi:hypothetical protein